jgi:hypothetical protein
MTAGEALSIVKGAATYRQYDVLAHAMEQASARNVQATDLRNAMMTATGAEWSESEETWRIQGGRDADGEPLAVVVTIEGNSVCVVTVF